MSETRKIIITVVVFIVFSLVYASTKLIGRLGRKKLKKGIAPKEERLQRVRLAFVSGKNILLCPKMSADGNGSVTDIPFETTLQKGESVERGLSRIVTKVFGQDIPDARFCLKYSFTEDGVVSDNYLFMIYCGDGCIPANMGGTYKLWTRKQIESNLEQGFFSKQFEEEYSHLRLVVDTWEMFS
ncbi:MAG: hypothetical protein NC206_04890 [Bacteroides sp.]|nr:hypothetical protein [Roseburia sp.]MCM1346401.1 hypothetical protein [Bacteroides sp.]MCM1420956.1 hypothetical protein [Bacteroides sp.]